MRCIRAGVASVTIICATASTSAAQTLTLVDDRGPRASVRIGYAGDGPDLETSVDSPLLGDILRLRGAVGFGRWDSEFDSDRNPTVTRVAASAITFIRQPTDLKPYIGVGLARLIPDNAGFKAQTSTHLIAGMEGSGDQWTVGVEVEVDLPHQHPFDRPLAGNELYLAGRIGISIRRSF